VTIFTLWFEDLPILAILAGAVGLGWGYLADRLAARWPEHEDGTDRRIDWRTPVVVIVGGLAFAATVARFGADPRSLVFIGIYVAALVVLFATDLDQRLLPDVITLPLIALAAIFTLAGWNPFIRTNDEFLWALGASAIVPLALFILAIPFGQGAIGQGDLKLLVSVGLLAGPLRMFTGVVYGALLAGIVIVVLLALRRITLKTFIPFGPFLIIGALWAILVLD
jgi:leader peptidase (prepilin peptidase) / N-methyltransferase